KALGDIGPPARAAVRSLINRIDDRQSWEIRKEVCYALGTVGRDEQLWPIPDALEALGRAVMDRDKGVRLEALQSVILLGPPYPPVPLRVRQVLDRRLKDERNKILSIWVRVAIMRLDESAINDANLSALSKQMLPHGTDVDTRIQAAKALGFIGPAAKAKVPEMIDALQKSDEPGMQYQLCWSLARMGQYAEKALGPLRTLQSAAKDESVRTAAKAAVGEIEKAMKQPAQPPNQPPKK
ncbi:MAG TPA: HEAT repeat domain-containing protein, partial [Gemmataceae bacterium]